MISNADNNIDNQIDNTIDNQVEQKLKNNISKSFVSSGIDVLSADFIEVTNYPLLNGVYRREFNISSGYFYVKIDSAYYFWISPENNFWKIFNLNTSGAEYASEDSTSNLIIPTTNWYQISEPSNIIPIVIAIIS
jgi:hypothetical protein